MIMMGKGKLGQPMLRWLLILSFWGVWMALPFIMFDDNDAHHRELFTQMLPATFTNVILFFIIAEWLGPKLLPQQRLKTFLLSVLGLSIFFLITQGLMKCWLVSVDDKGFVHHLFRSLVHVFFAAAMGLGYALIRHTFKEDKARQEQP